MKYEQIEPKTRAEIERDLKSEDTDLVCRALISLALNETDRGRAERRIQECLASADAWVRGVAATAAGHVARLHGELDLERTLPLVLRLVHDPETRGKAEDALDDIQTFIPESASLILSMRV